MQAAATDVDGGLEAKSGDEKKKEKYCEVEVEAGAGRSKAW
jgi:hypothetical protein